MKLFRSSVVAVSLACALATVPGSEEVTALFDRFIVEYKRSYQNDTKEYYTRREIFSHNLAKAKQEQLDSPSSIHGVTRFSDMTQTEFQAWTGFQSISVEEVREVCLSANVPPKLTAFDTPTSFDWRDAKTPVVSEVRDQGGCGSCWTFSAIGNIEGQYALAGNPLTDLSEQSILDCSKGCITHDGNTVCNEGCGGGWQFVAFSDMEQYGIPARDDYPYTAEDGTCKMPNIPAVAKIVNYTCVTPQNGNGADEAEMAAFLVQHGPLAMAMDARSLGSYRSGVLSPKFCSTTDLDHALLIVGFGTDTKSGKDYWTIKNSWGPNWGEQGYLRLERGTGMCGVNQAVTSAVVA